MSGLGRYPLNIPSLSTSFTTSFQNLGSSSGQRRDRVDYDDRRFRDRGGDSRSRDDYRQRDNNYSRRNTQRDRFSPEPSYSYSGDRRQGSQSNLVSYPLGHLDNSRSDRNNDRSDRNRYQNRDRYRNSGRSTSNRGSSNQGPGILGAKPGDRSVPELPASGLPATLGLSGNAGLTAQLAQQQQQLMAMVQTQSLLAAMQAQANAQAQARAKQGMPNPLGLLPTPLVPRGRDMQRPNRKRKMSDGWGGGGNLSYKRDRFDRNRGQQVNRPRGQNQSYRGRQSGGMAQNQQARKTSTVAAKEAVPEDTKEEEPEEEEEEEELEEEVEDNVEGDSSQEEEKQEQEEQPPAEPEEETIQPELPKSVNFVGQDVDALMVSLFDTKRCKYICQECKIISNKAMSFHGHLMGKRHAKTVLENQGKAFDYSEFKNFSEEKPVVEKPEPEEVAPVVEEEEKEKVVVPEIASPASVLPALSDTSLDFVRYTCDTRKSALKEGSAVTISSVTESRVRIEGFTSGRNMFGCEFVKAVSGFNCRLCKAFIRCGNDVIRHIKGKKHMKNYQAYVQEHPQYEEHQLARNKELEDVLETKKGQELVLYEVLDEDIKKSSSKPHGVRRDSQTMEPTELQITKFVIAPQSPVEEEHLKIGDEAADTSVNLEEVENLHDNSVMEESLEEHGDVSIAEEEEEQQQAINVHESVEEENESPDHLEQPSTLPPLVLEDCAPPHFEEPVKSEEEEQPKIPVAISPKLSGQKKVKEEPEDTDITTAEEQDTSPKVPTPTARRGRKVGTRGTGARGRGRGRGTRRSTRNAVGSARGVKVKHEKVDDEAENNDDMSFMEGFEVIDEIIDGED